MYKKLAIYWTIIWAVVLLSPIVQAQTVSVTQELYFGIAVIKDNNAAHVINVESNGTHTADNAFVFLDLPKEGIYQVTGLPPSSVINSVTVTVDQQMLGPGEDFLIDNFDVDAPGSSDGSGNMTIRIGARLQTSGSGQAYVYDANFSSDMTLHIDF